MTEGDESLSQRESSKRRNFSAPTNTSTNHPCLHTDTLQSHARTSNCTGTQSRRQQHRARKPRTQAPAQVFCDCTDYRCLPLYQRQQHHQIHQLWQCVAQQQVCTAVRDASQIAAACNKRTHIHINKCKECEVGTSNRYRTESLETCKQTLRRQDPGTQTGS